jgi:hypothetical protein
MGEGRVEDHRQFVAKCALGHAGNREYLTGMRSGFFDAAHLVDAFRLEIERSGRASKAKAEKIALLQKVGDAVWAMRDLLPTPAAEGGE